MRSQRLNQIGQDSFASYSEIARGAGDTYIEKALEEVGEPLRKAVDPDEEHRLKLKAFDVLYIKNAHFARVAYDASFLAANDAYGALRQGISGHVDERIDQLVTINENGNRRQPADILFHLVNARG